jgi:alanine dehydrogenase
MPSAVPKTSTFALTNATMPYVLKLADHGWRAACRSDPALAQGLATHDGALLAEHVARDLGLPFTEPAAMLA